MSVQPAANKTFYVVEFGTCESFVRILPHDALHSSLNFHVCFCALPVEAGALLARPTREVLLDKAQGRIGITCTTLYGSGVLVSALEEGSLASRCGLFVGDTLLSVNGVLCESVRQGAHTKPPRRAFLPRSRQVDPKLVWRQTPPGAEAPARRFKRLRRAS